MSDSVWDGHPERALLADRRVGEAAGGTGEAAQGRQTVEVMAVSLRVSPCRTSEHDCDQSCRNREDNRLYDQACKSRQRRNPIAAQCVAEGDDDGEHANDDKTPPNRQLCSTSVEHRQDEQASQAHKRKAQGIARAVSSENRQGRGQPTIELGIAAQEHRVQVGKAGVRDRMDDRKERRNPSPDSLLTRSIAADANHENQE